MMRYWRAFLIIALIGFSSPLYAPAQNKSKVNVSAVHTAQAGAKQQDRRVQTIQFESKMVGKTLPYNVLLPVGYNQPANRAKRYPVLYLLHGGNGHYTDWLEYHNWLDCSQCGNLADYAKPYELIIIMPEGNNGWYTDSATVPTDKYESYILEELIPDVQHRYRTIDSRHGRAIAGASMGGYGALKFGVKYPQTFAFAGSMSGALGAASWTEADLHGFERIWRTLLPVFGPEGSLTHATNDVNRLYRELPSSGIAALPYVYLDCGTEDPLLATNRSFVDILLARKIPHEYRQLPGTHAPPYFDAQVQEVLRIAARKMRSPAAGVRRVKVRYIV
jgi:S-formylglutathione hydrolase FrmB